MGVRSYLPKGDDDHLPVKTDILEDWPQHVAREQLIPSIAKLSRNALNVVPIYVEHFQRLKARRRCSCFTSEAEPQGLCPICYGFGDVGGYQKRGTYVDVFDVTAPYTQLVNVIPDYGSLARPVSFALPNQKGSRAIRGTVDFTWQPKGNIGILDDLYLMDYKPPGSDINYFLRVDTDVAWVPLTEASVTQRLMLRKPIRIQVRMDRSTVNTQSPKFTGIRVAYRTAKYTAIRADIPRTNRSRTLDDFGQYESTVAQNFFFGNDVKTIDNEDFFVNLGDNTRWKVSSWQDNKILGMNTSWDVECRLIQSYDKFAEVRLGRMDMLDSKMPPNSVRSIQTEEDVYYSKGNTHGRLPGERGDIDRAQTTTVGVQPGQTTPKPTPEK